MESVHQLLKLLLEATADAAKLVPLPHFTSAALQHQVATVSSLKCVRRDGAGIPVLPVTTCMLVAQSAACTYCLNAYGTPCAVS